MDMRDHGWFVFFAPRDNPQIAGVVMAEHGEHGSDGRADREARDGDVLREAGRPAAAGAAEHRQGRCAGARRPRRGTGARTWPDPGRRSRPMIVERRLSAHLDWPLLGALVALALIGLATIYSVTWDFRRLDQPGPQFWTQLYALPIALVAMTVCLMIDYRTLTQQSLILYGLFVLSLVAVMMIGDVRMGARRWMRSRRVLAAAVRIRPHRHRAGAGADLRRRPPRRAKTLATSRSAASCSPCRCC